MYIAGWKRLETPNLVKNSPNLVLKKFVSNLISGLTCFNQGISICVYRTSNWTIDRQLSENNIESVKNTPEASPEKLEIAYKQPCLQKTV